MQKKSLAYFFHLKFDCASQLFYFSWDAVAVQQWRWKFASLVQTTTKYFLNLFDYWIRCQESVIWVSFWEEKKIKFQFQKKYLINIHFIQFNVSIAYPICWLAFWLCSSSSSHQESCKVCCWPWLRRNAFRRRAHILWTLVLARIWAFKYLSEFSMNS